ncbi:MAG: hypothetical protein KC418_03610 [Anaerolineales bacterium]|nr:hypothetical protein [Anaerolineales bacterium]MCB8953267.1 hypothetical protein [Ardenticatenales bacterium]
MSDDDEYPPGGELGIAGVVVEHMPAFPTCTTTPGRRTRRPTLVQASAFDFRPLRSQGGLQLPAFAHKIYPSFH